MKNYIISVHSFVDIITNSSSEIFVVDENKIEETLKEIFKFLLSLEYIDNQSRIRKFSKYIDDFDDVILPDEYKNNIDSLYYLDIDENNIFLVKLVEKYFHPIQFKYIYD